MTEIGFDAAMKQIRLITANLAIENTRQAHTEAEILSALLLSELDVDKRKERMQ